MLTTKHVGLDRAELVTTALAVALSGGLYIAQGHPYLARGVVGDLLGLAVLSIVVIRRRRRLRHEALLCLFCIGPVLTLDPDWPVRLPGLLWWSAVTAAVAAYLTARQKCLHWRSPGPGASASVPTDHVTGDQALEAARRYDRWFESPWGRWAFGVEAATLIRAVRPGPDVRVLDAGCGPGRFASILSDEGARIVGIDSDRAMLRLAARRLPGSCAHGSVEHLPLRSAAVDVAVAVTVLEFVSDPAAALAELARVTRPGGRIVVGALNPRSPWGVAHRRRLRSGDWCRAVFLTRPQLRRLGDRHGNTNLRSALFAPGWFPGLKWVGAVLEAVGSLVPGLGAFQVLVVMKRKAGDVTHEAVPPHIMGTGGHGPGSMSAPRPTHHGRH